MRFNRIIFILLFPLIILACTSRKNKLDKSDRIPTDDLTDILTEISMTNGLLTIPRVHNWYTPADTMAPYNDVVERHGYKREDLDKTLKWYFVKNPKKLEKIFDNVLARLSEMETRYDQELSVLQAREANLWRGKEFFAAPVNKGTDSTSFKFRLTSPGVYQFAYTATIFPDDQFVAPKMVVFTTNPDSTDNGKKHFTDNIEYIRDGLPHNYFVNIKVPDQKYYFVSGSFINSCMPENAHKHFLFENISITRISGSV